MAIRNNKDLKKYLENYAKTQELVNDTQIRRALQSEIERLQRYLYDEVNNHYNNFTPEVYKRTGNWIESITVNPIVRDSSGYSVSITFDDSLAWHNTTGEAGYIPWLMEVGWKDNSFETPHFLGFKGVHYIKNAVERWNNDNKFGFVISVWNGNERYI